MARDDRMLRPFWLHQVAEYLVGLVLVALGLQSPDPLIPSALGAVIVINAAIVDGPAGAFKAVSRRTHRVLDLVVIGLLVAFAAIPGLPVDNASRFMMAAIAVVLFVVWLNSSFEARRARSPEASIDRPEAIGRGAGRLAGHAVKAFRNRQRNG